jgi:hypothetical protein
MLKVDRLKELKNNLDETYQLMRDILEKSNLSRRQLNQLSAEDYDEFQRLNSKSTLLISEFSSLLREDFSRKS